MKKELLSKMWSLINLMNNFPVSSSSIITLVEKRRVLFCLTFEEKYKKDGDEKTEEMKTFLFTDSLATHVATGNFWENSTLYTQQQNTNTQMRGNTRKISFNLSLSFKVTERIRMSLPCPLSTLSSVPLIINKKNKVEK